VTFLTVAIVPLVIVSALGAQAAMEASPTTLVEITAGTAVGAAWILSAAFGGWSGTSRIDVWLALFALGGAGGRPRVVSKGNPILSSPAASGCRLGAGRLAGALRITDMTLFNGSRAS
jgi:hypothetical protein